MRSLPSMLLRPAIAALDRLRLAHKLVVIALVLIAPALYATWQFRSQQNAQIAFSAKERVGIDEIVPAQRLLADLATTQSLAVRAAGRDAEATTALPAAQAAVARSIAAMAAADARLGPRLGTQAMWKRLRASIKASLTSEPIGATQTLAAYDRLTAGAVALIVQARHQTHPNPRPPPHPHLPQGPRGDKEARPPP